MNWQAILTASSPLLWSLLQTVLVIGIPIAIAAGVRYFSAHATGANYAAFRAVMSDAVKAAEQYLSTSDGLAKKAWVLGIVQTWLTANHVSIDATVVNAALESAVFTDINHGDAPAQVAASSSPNVGSGKTDGQGDLRKLTDPSRAATPKG